ncbi:MAG TPA: succinyldiaminopimelate transaminase [Woeseiaceae bacterium]
MNAYIDKLYPYPFERLDKLFAGIRPPEGKLISLSIGEPRHEPPGFVINAFKEALQTGASQYPVSRGRADLRQACSRWLQRRFAATVCPESEILPVNGTREGLFSLVQALVTPGDCPAVVMPNPFYQIYEGAALLAGAEPVYLDTTEETGFLPDLDAVKPATWERTALFFACSPGNPTGAVMDEAYWSRVIELADKYDFIIAADECYADIYTGAPPPSLLEVCARQGRTNFDRCIAFHSLSKRSNIPGLRSGFVAGDRQLMQRFLAYRTYHGCAMPVATQIASIAAWDDDDHVLENRRLYARKFAEVTPRLAEVFDVREPDAAFYLWPRIPMDTEEFTRRLYADAGVIVLPGSYLSRRTSAGDPAQGRLRISLVASVEDCVSAAEAMVELAGRMT